MALLPPSRPWFFALPALFVCSLFTGAQPTQAAHFAPRVGQPPPPVAASGLSGWFSLLWRCPPSGEASAPGPINELTDDGGRTYRLVIPEDVAQKLGGVQSLDQHRVSVSGGWIDARAGVLRVSALQMSEVPAPADEVRAADAPGPVTKPYALILCRFADTTSFTPHDKSYYEGLVGDVYPGASHFWNQSSFGAVRFTGSVAYGWYNLPQPASYYMKTDGSDTMDTVKLFNDATAAADKDIFYPNFAGISVFVNFNLGGLAYGTAGRTATLDGVNRPWPATWLPLWGHIPKTLCHEIGHSLGLLHSSGPYEATYDSRWDVMSGGVNTRSPDPIYGPTPQETIAWHKDRLGWIPAKQKYVAQPGSRQTLQFTRVSLPQSSDDLLLAQIFIGGWGTRFYTVELRQFAGYDSVGGLPGEGVVIHKVDTTLSDRNARVVDVDGNGDPNDAGAIWTPGETFTDTANGVTIAVEGATTTGMRVTISVSSDVPLPNAVTSTGDQGPGSLRNAILFANQFPGTAISFNVPPGDAGFSNGVFTLQPTASLPPILGSGIVIDGGTQKSRTGDTNLGRPLLLINGSRAGTVAAGLQIAGAGCQVRGLTINGFAADGIEIFGTGAVGNSVQGCYVGVNATGTSAVPNGTNGLAVLFGAKNNIIGGTTAASRNVISGNRAYGLLIGGESTEGNRIEGNFIGTDATGQLAVPNGADGLIVYGRAKQNTVGGLAAGAGNVISGNGAQGLSFYSAGTDGNVAQGNFIGTNATGRLAIPNGTFGAIVFGGAKGNTIGGTAAGAGNLISGNRGAGLGIQGEGTSGTMVQGNLIGTDATGATVLANGTSGVEIGFATQSNTLGGATAGARNLIASNGDAEVLIFGVGTRGNLVQGNSIGTDPSGVRKLGSAGYGIAIIEGASGNTVGGASAAAGNQIAFHSSDAILVLDAPSIGNALRGNSLFRNSGLGINLWGGSQNGFGVTVNDAGDGDTGPNNLQNYPSITEVTASGSETTIIGTLNSLPGATFALDFYASPVANPSGFGEGALYLGSTSVTTDSSGGATFVFLVATALADQFITATATNTATGDTSEFSQAKKGS